MCFAGGLDTGGAGDCGCAVARVVVSSAGACVARASVSGSAVAVTGVALPVGSRLRRAGRSYEITVPGGGLYAAIPGLGENDGRMSS